MIDADEVETLIVKDLSRLGREYLQIGYYTEIYPPQKGVRFIAVNDSVDSLVESSNDFNPICNRANELHAKDSSKKVRAVKKLQAERGKRLGGRPPCGYRKKDNDTKEIVPDEEATAVVKRIFTLCASGKGPSQIARILSSEKVLTPTNYYYRKTGKSHSELDTARPYNWSGSYFQPFHKPAVLLRCECLDFTLRPWPLKAALFQPFIQQQKSIPLPVQRFQPISTPSAE